MILRRYPEDFEKYNKFVTTIYVLCSCINKLAKTVTLTHGTLLYRGLGRMDELPKSFSEADEYGRKGYVEWGFMSTTSEKEVALRYSGVREGNAKAMVIEFPATSVDRGGCVKDFSQYPKVRPVV
jgi:NLR family CARD domain-containing protein 3